MTRIRIAHATFLLAAAMSLPLSGQSRQAPPSSQATPAPTAEPRAGAPSEAPFEAPFETTSFGPPVIRIGQDYVLRPEDSAREVVVIFGEATIEGRVDRNVVVVFGKAQLGSTAVIDGSLIVVAGSASIMSGARVGLDLVIVGAAFDAPPGFSPRGQHIVIAPAVLRGVVPWITRGLFWGRPIVPGLPWVWGIVGLFFLVYLVLNLVLAEPVRGCAETLAERPLTTFMVGLLVLILTGPVCLLLAISAIGIPVVLIVLCALFAAWIVGKVGVARWIGMSIAGEESRDSRIASIRSSTIGFALMTLAYMVPLLGLLAWTLIGVFGLGAAVLSFIAS